MIVIGDQLENRSFVLFITGIPSSGKTTLANNLARVLRGMGYRVEVLDGYWVRRNICVYEGYDLETAERVMRCTAWIARLLVRNGVVVICSFVAPSRRIRALFKEIVSEEAPVLEVYLKCRPEICRLRDNKGLYRGVERGEIKVLPGIKIPYEESPNPDIVVDTEKHDPGETLSIVLRELEKRGLIVQHRRTSS